MCFGSDSVRQQMRIVDPCQIIGNRLPSRPGTTAVCAFARSSDVSSRRKAAVRDDRPEIKPRQGFQMAKVVADILSAHRGTAAAAGHVNSVASSICHAFDQKPREICVLRTKKSPPPGPRSRAARPKTYLQAAAGPTDISVLSKIWRREQFHPR
jgi:hypothetical protein